MMLYFRIKSIFDVETLEMVVVGLIAIWRQNWFSEKIGEFPKVLIKKSWASSYK